MSTIKVDTVRPVTADASLTLQGDNSGTGVSGITIDSSGNATFAQTITGGTIGSSVVFPALGNAAVGTVSESSGTPTGDVVERGSNANGEYVKFADGTLICTFKDDAVASFAINGSYGSLYQGIKDFTLPATYIDTNYAVSSRVQYDTGRSWSQGYANTTTVVSIQGWDVVSRDGTATTRVAYLTIGKWY